MEVRIERSAGRVRLWPYGVHGRLRWRDLAVSPAFGGGPGDFVEWSLPLPGGSR